MDEYSSDTWTDTVLSILDAHRVRKPVGEVLLWEYPTTSATYFFGGILLFVIVEVIGIGFLTVVGLIAVLQLVIFRTANFMQKREFRIPGSSRPLIQASVDLKKKIVLTPSASTVSTSIEVIGDLIRTVEEGIKELSLSRNFFAMLRGFSILMSLSVLGKLVNLPTLLLILWVLLFIFPVAYVRNQTILDDAIDAVQGSIDNLGKKSKSE